MARREKEIRISPWFSLMGFLGFLGFLPKVNNHPNYFFFIFFGFFAWFFWGKLMKEQTDERMVENQKRASQLMLTFFILLSFALIFLLDRQVSADTVRLVGSLGYALGLILSTALVLYFDRVAG